jgi:DNA mismatch repair ATPase MutS
MNTGSFVSCKNELPGLIEKISNIRSITIGINLDFKMSPVEATLISVNDKKIDRQNIFAKLFSGETVKKKSNMYSLYARGITGNVDYMHPGTIKNLNLKMSQFFGELSGMLYGVIKPIEDELKKFAGIKTRLLSRLKNEFLYFIDIAGFIDKIMITGLPMCKPEVIHKEDRTQSIKNNFNMNLAFHLLENRKNGDVNTTIVKNDINIGDNGRILIITGPNQGGKTTYLNAVGLTQIFAQTGIFVPGTEAKLSVIDNILTHFPIEEKPDKLEGRLGEEAIRLKSIFEKVTKYSMVLLNESLTSTSPGESLYLAKDIMKILMITGSIVVYTTHLHELAMEIDDINGFYEGGSKLMSLVCMMNEAADGCHSEDKKFVRSYKIVPGKPMGKSYAREIAIKHGIDYDQLKEKLIKRGIIEM